MSTGSPRPREIKRVGRSTIEILWHDGHRSAYPNRYLRDHCPCAGCREHRPQESPAVSSGGQEPAAVRLDLVGRYAVAIGWSDGHDAGIYSYQTLRHLCPCPRCRSGEKQGKPSRQ